MHLVPLAKALALFSAGSSIPAKIAMIAVTINNSINVKTDIFVLILKLLLLWSD